MNLLELSKSRFSVRDYNTTPIQEEKLHYILETGRYAPSAVNNQPWKIYVVETSENLAKLHKCYPREWFYKAPVCLLICADHSKSWKRSHDGKDHADIDIAILTEHFCLAAAEVGIGCCWICNFDPAMCADLFQLPDDVEPVVILSLGNSNTFPISESKEKKRKSLDEIMERI